ncbi:MAG: amino acid ABC transporter ATP-binding protein [Chloroflexi bacterium]|nr:amino acid ABC transporter ATP-binding protein [Chloroflexota bacterium]
MTTLATGTAAQARAAGQPSPDEPVVIVEGLHKSYGALHVLKGVSLTVRRGEVVVLIGPSGSGKSTFLRCLNRLIDPEQGRIVVAGYEMTSPKTNLPRARRHIGLVSQHFNLYPHMTAAQNVMEGPVTVLRTPREEARRRAVELLGRVGLADKVDIHPRQLSGGQQQRVAIARALAMDPAVMLFDEPTSALDPELTGEVLDVMKSLADAGMTMLIVSHEMHFAFRVANRVVMFDEGVIIEEGPPAEMFSRAREERTRRFLSQLLSWEAEEGELVAHDSEGAAGAGGGGGEGGG